MKRIDANETRREFAAGVPPVITLEPGEVVRVELGDGLTGPLAVRDAQPGDTLLVELRRVKHASRGRIVAGEVSDGSPTAPASLPVAIENGLAGLPGGLTCAIRPFVAAIGTAPGGDAARWDVAGEHGGSLGCRRLRAQSRVYLPCAVSEALLSLGGLYGAVGDGATCGPGLAVKGAMDLSAQVLKELELPLPLAVEAGTVMVFGWGGSLEEAIAAAVRRAVLAVRRVVDTGATEASLFVGTVGQVRVCRAGGQTATARVELPLAFFAEHGVIL